MRAKAGRLGSICGLGDMILPVEPVGMSVWLISKPYGGKGTNKVGWAPLCT